MPLSKRRKIEKRLRVTSTSQNGKSASKKNRFARLVIILVVVVIVLVVTIVIPVYFLVLKPSPDDPSPSPDDPSPSTGDPSPTKSDPSPSTGGPSPGPSDPSSPPAPSAWKIKRLAIKRYTGNGQVVASRVELHESGGIRRPTSVTASPTPVVPKSDGIKTLSDGRDISWFGAKSSSSAQITLDYTTEVSATRVFIVLAVFDNSFRQQNAGIRIEALDASNSAIFTYDVDQSTTNVKELNFIFPEKTPKITTV